MAARHGSRIGYTGFTGECMWVDADEAGVRLSSLLELVAQGQTILIVHQGQPVAELIPARRAPAAAPVRETPPREQNGWWQGPGENGGGGWFGGGS